MREWHVAEGREGGRKWHVSSTFSKKSREWHVSALLFLRRECCVREDDMCHLLFLRRAENDMCQSAFSEKSREKSREMTCVICFSWGKERVTCVTCRRHNSNGATSGETSSTFCEQDNTWHVASHGDLWNDTWRRVKMVDADTWQINGMTCGGFLR